MGEGDEDTEGKRGGESVVVAGVLVVLWMAANFIGEELTSEAAEIRRDIKRRVKETKQHEMKAREGVREKMRGTYAMYNKKAARCGRT